LLRYYPTPFREPPTIGLEVQSPTGPGLSARFSDITVDPHAVVSIRDGT
jgi:hypothetical protein